MRVARFWFWLGLPLSAGIVLVAGTAWFFMVEGMNGITLVGMTIHPAVPVGGLVIAGIIGLYVGAWEGQAFLRIIPSLDPADFRRLLGWNVLCCMGGWDIGLFAMALSVFKTAGLDVDGLSTPATIVMGILFLTPLVFCIYALLRINRVISEVRSRHEG